MNELEHLEAIAIAALDCQWPTAEQLATRVSRQGAELLAAATPSTILTLISALRASQAATEAGISKISCTDDDVMLFRIPHKGAHEVARSLKHALPQGIRALVVTDQIEIATIGEEFMKQHGWVRA